ncbi:MAG: hypothetical protein AMJ73_03095 [candidate division Zixibacteria bacterium SM1_73]|nr:MAG: hypothetical protein AMJ73_03095 [candidate division Zixibacteria bacterium SM1_73]
MKPQGRRPKAGPPRNDIIGVFQRSLKLHPYSLTKLVMSSRSGDMLDLQGLRNLLMMKDVRLNPFEGF